MIGHDLSKPGDWYEEHYVVSQLLRLLLGEVESVTWEARGEDGVGVDCVVVERGTRVAVQCKTRSTRSWTIGDIINVQTTSGRSLLRDARQQLELHPGSRFRFVSDAPCPELKRVLEGVQTTSPEDPTWHTGDSAQSILEHWALRDGLDLLELAHDLLGRLELQVVDARSLDGFNQTLANALAAPGEASALITSLLGLARTKLTTALRIKAVEATLRRDGVTLQPRPGGPKIHRRLDQLAKSYVASITNARTLRRIDRAQTAQVLEALQQTEPEHAGQVILVHGPAGAGKSEVLCAVVEQLNAQDQPLLVLLPDQDEQELGLGGDPVATLRRHAGNRGAALVVDQLDQALMTGSSGAMVRRCQRWVESARSLGISVVVGCRTVDAEKETQLKTLLLGPDAQQPISIAVGDLEEPDVIQSLENRAALIDLDPPVRRLARRPLMLRLLVELIDNGVVVSGLTSAVEIVDRWWETISTNLSGIDSKRATDAMDQLLELIERDARLAIERSRLSDKQAIEALKGAGVLLQEERRGRTVIRPAHQYLSDVLIVRRWRELAAPDALLERLGPREDQSLHEARRLRLLAPLLADDRSGQAKLDAVMRSFDVRTLVKRGLLLGLASVEDPPIRLVSMVQSWLERPELKNLTMETLLRAQVQWIEAVSLAGWIDQEWRDSDDAGQHRILQLLASVAVSWGDGVSEHLARWSGDDGKVLELAGNVFLHNPGDDSDALFEMRLASIEQGHQPGWMNWELLLRDHPERATRLLAAMVAQAEPDDMWEQEVPWGYNIPTVGEITIAEHGTIGLAMWERLRSWWLSSDAPELESAPARFRKEPSDFMESLVELLAVNLAAVVASDPGEWPTLLNELPDPLRDLDGWLLCRIGASLPPDNPEACDLLVDWFISEDRWASLKARRSPHEPPLRLAHELVAHLGTLASDAAFSRLERAICRLKDPWDSEAEADRFEHGLKGGLWPPTSIGSTARELLPKLPSWRRSVRADTKLRELARKFPNEVHESPLPYSGYVDSKIPDHEADKLPVERWMKLLSDQRPDFRSSQSRIEWINGEPRITEISLSTLIRQLQRLAERSPRRYLAHARAFDGSVPTSARRAILEALVCQTSRGRPGAEPVEPLTDTETVDLVTKRSYLHEPGCTMAIAAAVAANPHIQWSDEVVERLWAIARQPQESTAFLANDGGLSIHRLNCPSCRALTAIGLISEREKERQEASLRLAEELAGSEYESRRAEAAVVAYRCRSVSPGTAAAIVLTACSRNQPEKPRLRVAAEPDVSRALFWIAARANVEAAQKAEACRLLLMLPADSRDWIGRIGGQAAIALRCREVITDEQLGTLLAACKHARLGAVDMLRQPRQELARAPWLAALALRLADDPDDEVNQAAARSLTRTSADTSLATPELLAKMPPTKGGRAELSMLVHACDRRASLLPVASVLIAAARSSTAMSKQGNGTPSSQEWSRIGLTGCLARLVEEAERNDDLETRAGALDAWDELLESGSRAAADALDERVIESI